MLCGVRKVRLVGGFASERVCEGNVPLRAYLVEYEADRRTSMPGRPIVGLASYRYRIPYRSGKCDVCGQVHVVHGLNVEPTSRNLIGATAASTHGGRSYLLEGRQVAYRSSELIV